jgi:hypothetical protein
LLFTWKSKIKKEACIYDLLFTLKSKKRGFPECLSKGTRGRIVLKNGIKNGKCSSLSALDGALGEEGFKRISNFFPECTRGRGFFLKKRKFSSPSVAVREEVFAKRNGGRHRRLKDRLGDQRGGSEWEPIKFFSEERTRPMPQIHNHGFPHELAKVA